MFEILLCYAFYIVVAIFIVSFLMVTRPSKDELSERGDEITSETIGWCILIFSLILGCNIANFYARYIEIRETFVNEVTNLQIISRILNEENDSMDALEGIKDYSSSVLEKLEKSLANGFYSPETAEKYQHMDKEIITFLKNTENKTFVTPIVNRMSTSQKVKVLVQEINVGKFYITILWLLFMLAIIPLYYSIMKNKLVQLILEFCLVIIFLTGLYVCTILNNPLADTPVKLDLNMYEQLKLEVEAYILNKKKKN